MLLAERLRAEIEQIEIPSPGASQDPLQLTISLGVASLNEVVFDSLQLVKLADSALCQAKAAGRNLVRACETLFDMTPNERRAT